MSSAALHAVYLLGIDLAVTCLLLLAYSTTGFIWFKNVFRGWDNMHAALFGGDGRHTISAYCGMHQFNGTMPVFGVVVRSIVDFIFGEWHCLDAAKREGLIS